MPLVGAPFWGAPQTRGGRVAGTTCPQPFPLGTRCVASRVVCAAAEMRVHNRTAVGQRYLNDPPTWWQYFFQRSLGRIRAAALRDMEPGERSSSQDTIGSFQNLFSSAPLLEGMASYKGLKMVRLHRLLKNSDFWVGAGFQRCDKASLLYGPWPSRLL